MGRRVQVPVSFTESIMAGFGFALGSSVYAVGLALIIARTCRSNDERED